MGLTAKSGATETVIDIRVRPPFTGRGNRGDDRRPRAFSGGRPSDRHLRFPARSGRRSSRAGSHARRAAARGRPCPR